MGAGGEDSPASARADYDTALLLAIRRHFSCFFDAGALTMSDEIYADRRAASTRHRRASTIRTQGVVMSARADAALIRMLPGLRKSC